MLAVNVREYVFPVPAVGVPERVAVPLWLSTKVTPLGSAPASVRDGIGAPVAVTEKVPDVPTVNVVLLALVMADDWVTVNMKLCEALPELLLACMVIEYVPPAAGVPLSVAVPLWLSTNVTPLGSAPVSVKTGVGVPVAVTENVPGVPAANVALGGLVNVGD